jgi:DNA-binding CsgD family transcriptional regulator
LRDRLTVTAKDLRSLVWLLDPERHDGQGDLVPQSFLYELGALIPCSVASFCLIDARHRRDQVQDCNVGGQDPGQVMPAAVEEELDELFWSAYWAEGGCSYVERTGDRDRVLRNSDLHSRREFSRTPMGEYCRRLGIRHELMVSLPRAGVWERRLLLFRTDGRDFSEREVLLMTLLRPTLLTIHHRHQRRRRGTPELTPRQWEILRLVAAGCTNTDIARTLRVSQATVRKHLENLYGRLDVGTRTAALAKVGPLLEIA